MKLSIVEIFHALERTKLVAQAWAHSKPELDEALDTFIKDLDQIGLELQNSVLVKARPRSPQHGSTGEGNMHDVVNCLVPAMAFAELIAEQQPEYTIPLKRFLEEVYRIKRVLLQKVYPDMFSDEE